MDRRSRPRRCDRRDGRDPDRALPFLHEPPLPRRVGREDGPTAVLRVADGLPTGPKSERESRPTRRTSSSVGALCEHARARRRGTRERGAAARASAAPQHVQHAKHPEFWAETPKPPRIAPRGLLLTDVRRRLAFGHVWLRMGSRAPTRSQRSRPDGFSPLAPSRTRESARIQAIARGRPGRSRGFALSRDECVRSELLHREGDPLSPCRRPFRREGTASPRASPSVNCA
ncbi:MAG: hypothetical protein RL385_1433 [Pseudomonadota bacterium]